MTDAERILQVLIHDARTPLGVAQGYIRLLREERLETPEERERALSRSMDALGRIARLLEDASAFLATPNPAAPTTTISAAFLAASVEARVREWEFAVTRGLVDPAARVRLGTSAERLAEAIACVAAAVRQGAGTAPPRLHIESATAGVRFAARADDRPEPTEDADPEASPFDAWKNGGLVVPLACRIITEAGGRIDRVGAGIVVTFPAEAAA
jgi:signal transduction histidine kinase